MAEAAASTNGKISLSLKESSTHSQYSRSSRGSNRSELSNSDFNISDDDWVQVGKLRYDSTAILGKGCEGTIVYK